MRIMYNNNLINKYEFGLKIYDIIESFVIL